MLLNLVGGGRHANNDLECILLVSHIILKKEAKSPSACLKVQKRLSKSI